MTNEQYLYISYFLTVAAGIALAILITAVLKKPLKAATDTCVLSKLGRFLRRIFPAWLATIVLLGFMMVSYFDCSHENYSEITADRAHLVRKTTEQLNNNFMFSAVALTIYLAVFILFIYAQARTSRGGKK